MEGSRCITTSQFKFSQEASAKYAQDLVYQLDNLVTVMKNESIDMVNVWQKKASKMKSERDDYFDKLKLLRIEYEYLEQKTKRLETKLESALTENLNLKNQLKAYVTEFLYFFYCNL